ncbi:MULTISPECIES: type I pantothenate kinase [unclassified Agarivorans]|uniref:type I pantothenate kinase n=1 Tax=unclassified Agarivorans TaxID=2636026 RepID=UPI0010F18593|nr:MULTISPECIES: type I pantothenate kinase [unclassified Agarivorans]MDO6687433.1 type I pantothenate kinase [Agarivorans sp. 3_MG-2023]MDO6715199.1 type I pantothenate kinase [Agarivorans sp. 2_MG-2023]MDO6763504.1 type I pantothenate kinase [Agarivorans sp. 1_MG-2023]GDY27233.1 pantothenate kinase [Agarivorans sp. Toyoura001]
MPATQSTTQHAFSYLDFEREAWSTLRKSVPLTLTEDDLESIRGINEALSLQQVCDIYLPLSRLLNLYVKARQDRREVLANFLGSNKHVPYIIGVSGSVAGGKSTTSRILQALLQRWPEHPKVDIVTTDGFLYPNEELEARGLMQRKGFPESYDQKGLVEFVSALKAGEAKVSGPIYSHLSYNIVKDKQVVVEQPDIVILEGLNVLQSSGDYPKQQARQVFVSDYLDFSIFVDAKPDLLETWYVERFQKFRASAFTNPNNYFHHYAGLDEQQADQVAKQIWSSINQVNLMENILPTRERADLILEKGQNHEVSRVRLRK